MNFVILICLSIIVFEFVAYKASSNLSICVARNTLIIINLVCAIAMGILFDKSDESGWYNWLYAGTMLYFIFLTWYRGEVISRRSLQNSLHWFTEARARVGRLKTIKTNKSTVAWAAKANTKRSQKESL